MLFAHGFGQTRHAWEGTATALAEAGYRTLSYDARGHGDSSGNDADVPNSAMQFTDDLIVVAGEQTEPPVLIAASMGGLFGLLAEARWPGFPHDRAGRHHAALGHARCGAHPAFHDRASGRIRIAGCCGRCDRRLLATSAAQDVPAVARLAAAT
ncbi:alpha/beta hydrolase [Xanthomonas populi]